MKKIMTLMLGLSFLAGTVGVMFAQEPPKTETKKATKKKATKKKAEAPKKEGTR